MLSGSQATHGIHPHHQKVHSGSTGGGDVSSRHHASSCKAAEDWEKFLDEAEKMILSTRDTKFEHPIFVIVEQLGVRSYYKMS